MKTTNDDDDVDIACDAINYNIIINNNNNNKNNRYFYVINHNEIESLLCC